MATQDSEQGGVMRMVLTAVTAVAILGGCTHASISSIPMEIEGVGTVYRYQGRANFSHQIAEADRMLTEHCKTLNGGRPVIVDVQKRDLGMVMMGSGQSFTHLNATGTGTPYGTNLMGTAMTTSSGTTSGMRNLNQEILFKCVTE